MQIIEREVRHWSTAAFGKELEQQPQRVAEMGSDRMWTGAANLDEVICGNTSLPEVATLRCRFGSSFCPLVGETSGKAVARHCEQLRGCMQINLGAEHVEMPHVSGEPWETRV